MVKLWLLEPGGSYFCENCFLEYEKGGKCECRGEITFISMHSNRYLSIWMKSRKAFNKKREMDNKAKIKI